MRILLLFFLFFAFYLQSQIIEEIEFIGLKKTKKEFLISQLKSKKGEVFNPEDWSEDFVRIQRLNLFFFIDTNLIKNDNSVILQFTVSEPLYLYPILGLGGFKDVLKLNLGFNEINFRGKGQSLGFEYQYYDRHSFTAFHSALRTMSRWGYSIAIGKKATVEPLYALDTTSLFNFDVFSTQLTGLYWIKRNLSVAATVGGFNEQYHQVDTAEIGLDQSDFSFSKGQIKVELEFKDLAYFNEKQKGIQSKIFVETVKTKNFRNADFWRVQWLSKYFVVPYESANLAFQSGVGFATNRNSPFSPYVVDGLVNVRAIGNRIARGTAITNFSAEWRQRILKTKWAFVQVVGFGDFAILRAPAKTYSMNNSPSFYTTGFGFRLYSRVLYKGVFRIDFALPNVSLPNGGFSFGLTQFF